MRLPYLAVTALCLCMPGLALAEEDASPAGSKAFEGWTATCNNLGACVAIGTTEAEVFFYVRIARDAGATAAPLVKLVFVTQDPPKGTAPAFSLTAKGSGATGTLGPFAGETDRDDPSQVAAILTASDSLGLIEAVRNADTLDYALLDTKVTLRLAGLSTALRWIDAQQGRAGTPTALVAKGMTPISQVPEPRRPPIIHGAAAGSAEEIVKPVPSLAVLDKAARLIDCEKETVQAHDNAEAWRLGTDLILVSVPCIAGAYNFSTALYFTDARGEAPRPVLLPQPATVDAGTSENVVTNMTFDPKAMTLSEFAKGRGIGDCGEARSWIWTGAVFTLLSASRLDACPGALQDDWPNIYSAPRG